MSKYTTRDAFLSQKTGVPLERIQKTFVCELTGVSLKRDGELAVRRAITRTKDTGEVFVRSGEIYPWGAGTILWRLLQTGIAERKRLIAIGFEAVTPLSRTPLFAAAQKRLREITESPHPKDYVQRKWLSSLTRSLAEVLAAEKAAGISNDEDVVPADPSEGDQEDAVAMRSAKR